MLRTAVVTVWVAAALAPMAASDAAAQAALSPEHERIDFLIGEWRTTSELPDGREAPGELSYRWVQGGAWMQVEFHGDHPDGRLWDAHVMQRWVPGQGQYEAWAFGADGPPERYRGTSEGPGHYRLEGAPQGGSSFGIDYHLRDDGTVYQENWAMDGGERRITLRTRYRPAHVPTPPPSPGDPPRGASAADADRPEAAEVLAVVDRLFDGMRARSAPMLEEVFHPEARMVVAPPAGAEPGPVSIQGVEGFIRSVGAGGPPFHEPYFAPEVRIDGNLAHVWTFYHFYPGDEFSHCGIDSIELLRGSDGWEITFIAYTRKTEGCGEG